VLDRLPKFQFSHFRRELVRRHQYLEATARRALVDAASAGGAA
jgi:hypothetical protein